MSAAAELSGHAGHAGVLLGPMLLLAFWAGWSDLRAWMHRQGAALCSTPVLIAAVTSVAAAAIHLLVVPAHLSQDPLYGAFFLAAAAAQLAWGIGIVRRTCRRLLLWGAAANLLLIALWVQTRLVAIPVGVAVGTREGVGVLDVTCVALEAVVVACAIRAVSPLSVAVR